MAMVKCRPMGILMACSPVLSILLTKLTCPLQLIKFLWVIADVFSGCTQSIPAQNHMVLR